MFIKNTTGQVVFCQMNSRADGSPLTSAVSVTIAIDGAADAAGAGTLTHVSNGKWKYAFTQAETNGDVIGIGFVHATGVNQTFSIITQPGDTYGVISNGTYGNSALKTLIDTVDIVADAIKAKTDNIPAAPATETKQDTIIGYIDTEVAAIKAKTDNLNFTGTDVKATLDSEKVTVTSNEDKTGYTIAAGGVPIGAFASGAITDAAIASDAETAIATAVKDLTVDGYTWQQIMSVMLAVLAGITADGGLTIKNPAGSATRVTAVVDANNNRTNMTLNPGS